MNIVRPCVLNDTPAILQLYAAARALQVERKMVVWPDFEPSFIDDEINESRQWKIMEGPAIACNWATTFDDPQIWGARDQADGIYIHRICNHPEYRGRRYIDAIVSWAKRYALEHGRAYVRLDTLGNNTKLIEHYSSAGFTFLGIYVLEDTSDLPLHYQLEPNCCLFEVAVS